MTDLSNKSRDFLDGYAGAMGDTENVRRSLDLRERHLNIIEACMDKPLRDLRSCRQLNILALVLLAGYGPLWIYVSPRAAGTWGLVGIAIMFVWVVSIGYRGRRFDRWRAKAHQKWVADNNDLINSVKARVFDE